MDGTNVQVCAWIANASRYRIRDGVRRLCDGAQVYVGRGRDGAEVYVGGMAL